MKTIDVICIGELLVDFIGEDIRKSLSDTKNFNRIFGGSASNVARNISRLGLSSALVGTVGKDGLGDYLINELKKDGINISGVSMNHTKETSIILVSKTTGTPEFIPYRSADAQILKEQLPDELLKNGKILHTTCFALSRNPARDTILEKAFLAKKYGLLISIDLNYSEKIWPNIEEAKQVVGAFLKTNPLVKLSEDDCNRWFHEEKDEDYILSYFHDLGAKIICLTKGKNGVIVSDIDGTRFFVKAPVVTNIVDATGAGDAFWSGFLSKTVENKSLLERINFSQKVAAIKLQRVGGLPTNITTQLY